MKVTVDVTHHFPAQLFLLLLAGIVSSTDIGISPTDIFRIRGGP